MNQILIPANPISIYKAADEDQKTQILKFSSKISKYANNSIIKGVKLTPSNYNPGKLKEGLKDTVNIRDSIKTLDQGKEEIR